MSLADDIARIREQEAALVFPRFDADAGWMLGSLLRQWAAERRLPVAIDIRRFDGPVFFAALPGAVPDNAEWARRKGNVVRRFGRSSYGFGRELEAAGATLEGRYGLTLADHAAHGGGFPLTIAGAGVIGSITVSGLPQREDHDLVVAALCRTLGRPDRDLALDPV